MVVDKFRVTPWEVSGEVDYNRLIEEFGTKPLTDAQIKKIEQIAGKSHHMLRRRIFFSHRELDILLKEYESGQKFALYTGRGPSGNTHMGHIIPWIFTKYLQDAFDAPLYFQITDDEKFLCKPDLSLEETNKLAYENALDLIALGFDPKKTFIIVDTDYAKSLYKIAIQVAKKVTASTAKSVFGFTNETNIGMYFWPALQAAPCFVPSIREGKNVRTLIPAAIDQDPYWRIVRDVAPKLGYLKTAAIHNVFLPALTGPTGKMSTSSGQHATVFTTDDEKTVRKKIMKYAFSGGRDTVEEHRKLGGNPDIDSSYQWLRFFEEDDEKLKQVYLDYKSGKLLSGELKQILVDKINGFLKIHQKKKEEMRGRLDEFLLKD
ncbi:tryptophan--tRNA ligase [Candidatus Woesearchaeota archaeon]|nr:tryptophan--tRNA ligase [Candidatus Woesearchaeota archaeon]